MVIIKLHWLQNATIWNNNGQTKSLKLKGVSLKKNDIKYSDYQNIIENQSVKQGKNFNLQMNGNQMSKLTINKISIHKNDCFRKTIMCSIC